MTRIRKRDECGVKYCIIQNDSPARPLGVRLLLLGCSFPRISLGFILLLLLLLLSGREPGLDSFFLVYFRCHGELDEMI